MLAPGSFTRCVMSSLHQGFQQTGQSMDNEATFRWLDRMDGNSLIQPVRRCGGKNCRRCRQDLRQRQVPATGRNDKPASSQPCAVAVSKAGVGRPCAADGDGNPEAGRPGEVIGRCAVGADMVGPGVGPGLLGLDGRVHRVLPLNLALAPLSNTEHASAVLIHH